MYGAFQGYARAFYAEIIPLGEETRWYALYSITDKVCSRFKKSRGSFHLMTP